MVELCVVMSGVQPACLCVVDETLLFPNSWCSTHDVSGTDSGLIVGAGNDVLEKICVVERCYC